MRSKLRKEDVYRIICYVVFGVVASTFIISWHTEVSNTFVRQEQAIALYKEAVQMLQASDGCTLSTPTSDQGTTDVKFNTLRRFGGIGVLHDHEGR